MKYFNTQRNLREYLLNMQRNLHEYLYCLFSSFLRMYAYLGEREYDVMTASHVLAMSHVVEVSRAIAFVFAIAFAFAFVFATTIDKVRGLR